MPPPILWPTFRTTCGSAPRLRVHRHTRLWFGFRLVEEHYPQAPPSVLSQSLITLGLYTKAPFLPGPSILSLPPMARLLRLITTLNFSSHTWLRIKASTTQSMSRASTLELSLLEDLPLSLRQAIRLLSRNSIFHYISRL